MSAPILEQEKAAIIPITTESAKYEARIPSWQPSYTRNLLVSQETNPFLTGVDLNAYITRVAISENGFRGENSLVKFARSLHFPYTEPHGVGIGGLRRPSLEQIEEQRNVAGVRSVIDIFQQAAAEAIRPWENEEKLRGAVEQLTISGMPDNLAVWAVRVQTPTDYSETWSHSDLDQAHFAVVLGRKVFDEATQTYASDKIEEGVVLKISSGTKGSNAISLGSPYPKVEMYPFDFTPFDKNDFLRGRFLMLLNSVNQENLLSQERSGNITIVTDEDVAFAMDNGVENWMLQAVSRAEYILQDIDAERVKIQKYMGRRFGQGSGVNETQAYTDLPEGQVQDVVLHEPIDRFLPFATMTDGMLIAIVANGRGISGLTHSFSLPQFRHFHAGDAWGVRTITETADNEFITRDQRKYDRDENPKLKRFGYRELVVK